MRRVLRALRRWFGPVMATERVVECNGGGDPAPMPEDAPVSKAEIAEALTHLNAYVKRMPSHWVRRRAEVHAQINALLDQWEAAP